MGILVLLYSISPLIGIRLKMLIRIVDRTAGRHEVHVDLAVPERQPGGAAAVGDDAARGDARRAGAAHLVPGEEAVAARGRRGAAGQGLPGRRLGGEFRNLERELSLHLLHSMLILTILKLRHINLKTLVITETDVVILLGCIKFLKMSNELLFC